VRATITGVLALVILGAATSAERNRSGDQDQLTPEEIEVIFDEFRHELHEEAFTDEGIGCVACHQVGGRTEGEPVDEALRDAYMTAPPASCHYCHRPGEQRAAIGPEGCQICHGEGYQPESHGPAWADMHGSEVRMIRPGCGECHDTGQCISCHENRGALSRSEHTPGWGAVHGIEARFDPQACVTCHAGDSCVSCHERGRSPW
jgi:hypothetical protein